MGYCYTQSGKLVCDACNNAGSVRKRKCAYGYCPSPAYCSSCYASRKEKRKAYCDENCAPAAKRMAERERAIAELYASGATLRCSARNAADGRVHVLFRGVNPSRTIGYYMSAATYDAISLLDPATPADYEKHGAIEPAPADFFA